MLLNLHSWSKKSPSGIITYVQTNRLNVIDMLSNLVSIYPVDSGVNNLTGQDMVDKEVGITPHMEKR